MTEEITALLARTIVAIRLKPEDTKPANTPAGAEVYQLTGSLDDRSICIMAIVTDPVVAGVEPRQVQLARKIITAKMAEIVRFGWPQPKAVTL